MPQVTVIKTTILILPRIITEAPAAVQNEETEEVIIDICGAVNDSKVVTLPAGARVEDAIKAAGGITDEADLSGINRAAVLTDGEKIYIPTADEVERGIELSLHRK